MGPNHAVLNYKLQSLPFFRVEHLGALGGLNRALSRRLSPRFGHPFASRHRRSQPHVGAAAPERARAQGGAQRGCDGEFDGFRGRGPVAPAQGAERRAQGAQGQAGAAAARVGGRPRGRGPRARRGHGRGGLESRLAARLPAAAPRRAVVAVDARVRRRRLRRRRPPPAALPARRGPRARRTSSPSPGAGPAGTRASSRATSTSSPAAAAAARTPTASPASTPSTRPAASASNLRSSTSKCSS